MTSTRTQYRAICPACFNQQALTSGGKLVAHGYTIPQHWHSRTTSCYGAGKAHFGTAAGRTVTSEIATGLRRQSVQLVQQADEVVQGTGSVWGTKRNEWGTRISVVIESPTTAQRAAYSASLLAQSKACIEMADDFDAKAAAWTPAQPVAVVVEAAKGPLVHLKGSYYDSNSYACAGSAMAAQKYRATTAVLAEVTCEKCQTRAAERLAKGWPITQARAKAVR